MNRKHYLDNGFEIVGSITRDSSLGKKKYDVYVQWLPEFEAEGKMGVYIIFRDNVIYKIGETQNLKHRFQCYESHSGPTNVMVRENIDDVASYGIMFIECPSYNVGFAGVRVPSGINYRFLEKALLKQYVENLGELPKWNKGIQ